MVTMAVVDGNDELGRNESLGGKDGVEIADPVVYKLVRVDGDGRIISATDDDVMEVDDLLEEDKTELLPLVADTRQATECVLNEAGVLPVTNNFLGSEGISNNVEVKLQELKAPLEETVPLVSHGVNDKSTTLVGVEMCMKPSGFLKICGPSSLASVTCSGSTLRISNKSDVKVHKLKAPLEETVPVVSHGANDKCTTQVGVEMCVKPASFLKLCGPSSLASVTCSSSMLEVSNNAEVLPARDDKPLTDPSSQETVPLVSHGVNDKCTTQVGVQIGFKPSRFLKICGPSSLASATCGSSMLGVSNNAVVEVQKLKAPLEETVHLVSPVNDKCTTQVQGETCLKPADALRISKKPADAMRVSKKPADALKISKKPTDALRIYESSSSASASCSSSIPDFSKIKGEICLDNLSVKELQETFRATFGRETTVKDKLWLKRRIAMGLTNSCDVATTTFTIKDKTLIRRKKIEGGGAPCEIKCSESEDQIDGIFKGSHKDSPITPANKVGDEQVSGKRQRKSDAEDEYICEDPHNEHSKRVRKPTKRYIEEISKDDNSECSGKPVPSVKSSGNCQSEPNPLVKPVQSVSLDKPVIVTRQQSFGGSGVQVPYVSRVRRGRPRENFMPLMKFHPGCMGVDPKPVTKTLDECVSQLDKENGDKDLKAKLAPQQSEEAVASDEKKEEEEDKENHNDAKACISVEKLVEMKNLDLAEENSDHNLRIQSTTKGEPVRKHHRAWTLSEVTQLVEGVAKFGVGRWSEIKKLSFTSYSYRTSVDLKDKWRNLLRASYARPPAVRDMLNSKKHGSAALPAHILLRVRELAEKYSQGPPPDLARKVGSIRGRKPGASAGIFGRKIVGGVKVSRKVKGVGGAVSAGSRPIVNETRSGFL